MITPKNQAAIAVLNDIYAGGDTARTDACRLTGARHGYPAFKAFKCRTHQTLRQGGSP